MKRGTIVTVPFPFTDLTGRKTLPALVLAIRPADVTVAFISSQLQHRRPPDVVLQASAANGLRHASLLCTDKLATVETQLVLGELGELESDYRVEFNQKIIASLTLPVT